MADFFLFLLTIYKEKIREMKQKIRINENQLKQIVTESVKRVLKESTSQAIKYNLSITVNPQNSSKVYALINKLQSANWVLDFENYEEPIETQRLSIRESGFNPLIYDKNMGWYEPHDIIDGEDNYTDFDDMSDEELYALKNKYLEQAGHTPYNKLANARPDIFHALQAIDDEIEYRKSH